MWGLLEPLPYCQPWEAQGIRQEAPLPPPSPRISGSKKPPQLSVAAEATHIRPVYLRWWISLPILLSAYCHPQELSCLGVRSVSNAHVVNGARPTVARLHQSPGHWGRPTYPPNFECLVIFPVLLRVIRVSTHLLPPLPPFWSSQMSFPLAKM